MTLYNRPVYARQVLHALSECAGIEEYVLILMVEPVNQDVIEIAKSIRFTECRPIINSHRYGPHRNTYEAFKHGFEISDFVIYCQEDDELAPDALRYFEHCARKYQDDKTIFTVSAWSFMKKKDSPPEDAYYRVFGRKLHVPYTLATWRDRWEEPSGMRDNWDMDAKKAGGWDMHLEANLRRGRFELYPALPRANNIGAEGGAYTPSKEWHMGHVNNEFWAGDAKIRSRIKTDAVRWSRNEP